MNIFNLLKSLPAQLIFSLILGIFFGCELPQSVSDIFYTISCNIKDMLMLILPSIIFCYLWAAIVSFGNQGISLILSTFGLIVVANLVALFTAYSASVAILPHIVTHTIPHFDQTHTNAVQCLWTISDVFKVDFLQPKHGMLAGIILGFITIFISNNGTRLTSTYGKSNQTLPDILIRYSMLGREKATHILRRCFIPFLPLYVLGFVVKLARDGQLINLIHGCAKTAFFIWGLIVVHIFVWYFIASKFNLRNTFQALKNMMPAGLTGFTTMSSSATLPVTLDCMEKNIKDRSFADFFAPATANPHMTGDGLSITVISLALLLMSGHSMPPLSVFVIYAVHYCMVKFSAAGVPGGGVIVILPVARDYLGLDENLMPLLQTIYMLQDPILTSTNVMGNGAFGMVAHRLMKPFLKTKQDAEIPKDAQTQ